MAHVDQAHTSLHQKFAQPTRMESIELNRLNSLRVGLKEVACEGVLDYHKAHDGKDQGWQKPRQKKIGSLNP